MGKRSRVLAAALGCVAAVGTFVAFETIGDFSISGGGRPVKVPQTAKSPSAAKNIEATEKTEPQIGCKAFLVGADAYDDVAQLRCVKNDVEALARRLVEIGADENNVMVLKTGGKSGDIPTKAQIEARFETFVDSLEPGDFAVVFLSGHGFQADGETRETFFAPVDANPRDLFGSSVSIDKMLERLDKSRAKSRWLIVDACRNVPEIWQTADVRTRTLGGAKGLTSPINAPESTALLQSCQQGEVSYEADEHGFFTRSLLEALDKNDSKADKDGDGVLYFTELIAYVTARTDALAKERVGVSQKPSFSGKMTDFAVLNTRIEGLPPQRWRKANAFYERAAALENEGKLPEALAEIKAALEINPNNENYQKLKNRVENLIQMLDDAARKAQEEKEAELNRRLEAALAAQAEAERKAQAAEEAARKAQAEAEKAEATRKQQLEAEATRKAQEAEAARKAQAAEEAARKAQEEAEKEMFAAAALRRGVEYEYGLGGVAIDLKKAFELYSEAARLGSASAASRLGQCYEMGIGVERDEKKAVESIRKAAEANDVWATTILASYYERGFGDVEKDAAKGFALRRKAAELGGAEEKRALAWCFANGIGCEPDVKQALALIREAAELGDVTAMRELGEVLALGELGVPGVERDEAEAFEWLRKAAELGYIESARELFRAYDLGFPDSVSGEFLERNPEKAFAALEIFATRPDCPYPDAKFALAVAYAYGYGVEQDAKKAFALFKEQAEADECQPVGPLHEALLLALALCYERGFGVAEDVNKTIELYKKGANLDYPTSTANLGWCYANGRGVSANRAEALRYYRRASDLGETGASLNLGKCYENGDYGLPRDAKKAFELYKKAADAGDSRGMLEVARCYENGVGVEPNETEAAKQRERAWNATAFFVEPIPTRENTAPPSGLRLSDLGLFVGRNIPFDSRTCTPVAVYPAPCGFYAPLPVCVPVPAEVAPAEAVPVEAAPCVPDPCAAAPCVSAPIYGTLPVPALPADSTSESAADVDARF